MILALNIFTVAAVSAGTFFFLAGTVGLLRFPDPLTRLRALLLILARAVLGAPLRLNHARKHSSRSTGSPSGSRARRRVPPPLA